MVRLRWIITASVLCIGLVSCARTPVIDDLPATFSGELPCADCPAIRHHLNLLEDGRYALRRVYVDRPGVFDEAGVWSVSDGRLTLRNDQGERQMYRIGDDGDLEALDQRGERIDTTLDYTLNRLSSFAPIDSAASDPSMNSATLENTYWKLTSLAGQALTSVEPQREAHLIFQPQTNRVAGSGGCNRIMGGYTVSSDQISFSQMGSTMMACAQGMQQERAFLDVLPKAARWRIEGDALRLFSTDGQELAAFEARPKP